MTLQGTDISLDYIRDVLNDLLMKKHTHPTKQRSLKPMPTSIHPERLACACPVCGDSDKQPSKRRGNLYLKNMRYKCFNCDYSSTFLGLLKRFDYQISTDKKLELVEYISNNIENTSWNDDQYFANTLDKLIPIEDLTNYFNNDPDSKITDFRPVQKGSIVYKYLVNRKIFEHSDIYEGTYWHTNKWSEPVLINVNQAKDHVLGIQTRNLKADRTKRFYKIFKFSELYNAVYPDKELDEIEVIGYDKLSYLYNILKVDWTRPVTVFEGFLDTKFFPNAIGCTGTSTDLTFILNQEADIRFVYDYDKTGMKKTKKMLSQEYSVFLWDLFFKEWSKQSKNPQSAYRKIISNIVDLNDVGKVVTNPYIKLEMERFFSRDRMDLMYIKDLR
jgi:hypothetical protein